jgi:hypothetical protein
MKINFTKKEYQALVEMLLVADWVIHGHEVEPRVETKPYDDLRKKVLSHYKEMGMEDAFEYVAERDDYYETAEHEERAPHMRFVDEDDEETFWQLLSDKLANRDLAAQEVVSTAEPLEGEQRVLTLFEIIARYEEELAENGLDNVRVVMKAAGLH